MSRDNTGSSHVFLVFFAILTLVPAFAICQVTVVNARKLHPDPKTNSQHGTFHCLREERNATSVGTNQKNCEKVWIF